MGTHISVADNVSYGVSGQGVSLSNNPSVPGSVSGYVSSIMPEVKSNDSLSFADALLQQEYLDNQERAFNSAEAQKNRDWQEYMSDTAIRRYVEDLQAAGLNKWLALNSGGIGSASTPSGASASASSGNQSVSSILSTLMNKESKDASNNAAIGKAIVSALVMLAVALI